MSLSEKFNAILTRYENLQNSLSFGTQNLDSYITSSKELSSLESIVQAIQQWQRSSHELQQIQTLLSDPGIDPDLQQLAEEEKEDLKIRLQDLQYHIQELLIPSEDEHIRNAILEVRAGTGGLEAALFAGEIFQMYQRYSTLKDWKFETLNVSVNDIGGFKESVAAISGEKVFSYLKFESGVHRVQRIPITETNGRIHTSTVTVAVLPEAQDVDIQIEDKDLRIDVFRARGPGGQSVNTTDSAVRITHLPTGLVVSQQDQKSQYRNKMTALRILRSRLKNLEEQTQATERASERKKQVGSGERSERIRTYNFPQGRVTDHRIHSTLYKLEDFMSGQILDEFINVLLREEKTTKLTNLTSS